MIKSLNHNLKLIILLIGIFCLLIIICVLFFTLFINRTKSTPQATANNSSILPTTAVSVGDIRNGVSAADTSGTRNDQPALQNLGINLAPYDKNTGKAGDFVFSAASQTTDSQTDFPLQPFDSHISNEMGTKETSEYEYNAVSLGTQIISPINGVVTAYYYQPDSKDYELHMKPTVDSSWIVSFDHVVNAAVKIGDSIKTGQVIAIAAPSPDRVGLARTELQINQTMSNNHQKIFCPYTLLSPSLQSHYAPIITSIETAWEQYINKPGVYNIRNQPAPACNTLSYTF